MSKRITAFLQFAIVISLPAIAVEDGAALFKTKCPARHGKTGPTDTPIAEAKNIKDLGSPEIQKWTDAELTDMIANGGAEKVKGHDFKAKRLTDDLRSFAAFAAKDDASRLLTVFVTPGRAVSHG